MSAPERVLLNALYLAPGTSGGTETYLRGLAPALARERPLRLTIATTPSGAAALRRDGFGAFAEIRTLPCEDGQRVRRQWAEQVLLPRLVRASRAQVVHSLATVNPVWPGAASVVTLHDVIFLEHRTVGRITEWGMGGLARVAAHRADALITGSEAAIREISEVLSVDPSRFTAVHHGMDPPRQVQPAPEHEVRERYDLHGTIVLCVAAKRPHKNQELLVRAAQWLGGDTQVALVGHAEAYEQRLRELVDELGLQERVRFLGYVPDADLEALWRLAGCACFPTLAEGFGMPITEALARGVAVAASDLAVLREIGGEVPHFFDPHDPADCARAVREALADTRASTLGPRHVGRFTWGAAARATLEVYERALASRARAPRTPAEAPD